MQSRPLARQALACIPPAVGVLVFFCFDFLWHFAGSIPFESHKKWILHLCGEAALCFGGLMIRAALSLRGTGMVWLKMDRGTPKRSVLVEEEIKTDCGRSLKTTVVKRLDLEPLKSQANAQFEVKGS